MSLCAILHFYFIFLAFFLSHSSRTDCFAVSCSRFPYSTSPAHSNTHDPPRIWQLFFVLTYLCRGRFIYMLLSLLFVCSSSIFRKISIRYSTDAAISCMYSYSYRTSGVVAFVSSLTTTVSVCNCVRDGVYILFFLNIRIFAAAGWGMERAVCHKNRSQYGLL